MKIVFVYIYNEINSRPRRYMRRKRSTLLLLLWYALTLTAFLFQSQENFVVFSKQTFCLFQTTSREPNWQRFILRSMQCLSQLITKGPTHLSKISGTVQTCREENAILLVRSQDKYYFNFYEFLKLSCACDIVQKNMAKISLFVMFIIFFSFFWFPLFIFIFLTICHPSPTTRHPLPVTRHPSLTEKSCRPGYWVLAT